MSRADSFGVTKNTKAGKNPKGSSGFFEAVYELVATIPSGKVMTYGQIARVLNSPFSARIVGYAMSSAPNNLPCHRVVNRKGEMAGGSLFGGPAAQRALLEAEGVQFLANGCINLNLALYNGPEDDIPDIEDYL